MSHQEISEKSNREEAQQAPPVIQSFSHSVIQSTILFSDSALVNLISSVPRHHSDLHKSYPHRCSLLSHRCPDRSSTSFHPPVSIRRSRTVCTEVASLTIHGPPASLHQCALVLIRCRVQVIPASAPLIHPVSIAPLSDR